VRRRIALIGFVLMLAGTGPAAAGPPGKWMRVTTPDGRNTDQVGLARTRDGTLHFAWTRRGDGHDSLLVGAMSRAGELVGSPTAVQRRWPTITNPALLALPRHGLVAVFGGVPERGADSALYAASAGPDGSSWSFRGPVSPPVSSFAPSDQIAAAVGKDGTPFFAWSSTFDLSTHAGLDPAMPNQTWQSTCCAYYPGLGADTSSGAVVMGWYSNALGSYGLLTRVISPSPGDTRYLPGSANEGRTAAVSPEQKIAVTGRIGKAGLYVAYGAGYPTWTSLWVSENASARAVRIWDGTIRHPTIAAGPDGRLWVAWDTGDTIYVRRSDPEAKEWGAVTEVKPPARTRTIWKLSAEGSGGPLDLFVSASTPGSLAFWHQQVLPALTLGCRGGRVVRCTVSDAGDPVRRAVVRAGGRSFKTGAQGRVRLDLEPGPYLVTATKPGYATQTARVRAV
jgi:hypothetical protein